MKSKSKKILLYCILSGMLPLGVMAAPIAPITPHTGGMFDAGALNKHQIDYLKNKEMTEQKIKDLEHKEEFIPETDTNNEQDKNMHPINSTSDNSTTDSQLQMTIEKYKNEGFYLKNIEVDESYILSNDEIKAIIEPLVGRVVQLQEIKDAIDKINTLYAEKNYITARAYLEDQVIDEGTIRISLLEGRVGYVKINGNKCTTNGYIMRRLDNMDMGNLLELRKLEQDVIQFNHVNEGIVINANLVPGEVVATSDLEISVRENFPFHVTLATDNAGRETIGQNRFGVIGQIDSLTGHRDKLTGGTYLSKSSVTPFIDYNIPLNKSGGRLGFSYSASNMDVTKGDYAMFDISGKSQSAQLYYSQPIIDKPWLNLTSISNVAYKTASTSIADYRIYRDKVITLGTGIMARKDSRRGIWYTNHNVSYSFPMDHSFYDPYFRYEGGIIRVHDFGKGIIGQFRGLWQYSPEKYIPSLDQFQIGGVSTVRGYSEGALIGRTGYLASAEVIFPITPTEWRFKLRGKERIIYPRNLIKGAVFVDHGAVFPGGEDVDFNYFLASAGFGFRVNLPFDLTGKFYWGFPFLDSDYLAYSYMPRFHFEITASPDFDRLIDFKNRRMEQRVQRAPKTKKKEAL